MGRLDAGAAYVQLVAAFPIEGIVRDRDRYIQLRRLVDEHAPGRQVLDFGSGACDKAAILALGGYEVDAYDDLGDDWHREEGNDLAMAHFAQAMGIRFCTSGEWPPPYEPDRFDVLMILDVIEHLHESPRQMLTTLLKSVRPGGILFATIPNVANLRKRIDLLRGRTNLQPFNFFYWYPGTWRGHVREYSRHDCLSLIEFLGLELVTVEGINQMLERLPQRMRRAWAAASRLTPGLRDTWLIVARKPEQWAPMELTDELRERLGTVAKTTL